MYPEKILTRLFILLFFCRVGAAENSEEFHYKGQPVHPNCIYELSLPSQKGAISLEQCTIGTPVTLTADKEYEALSEPGAGDEGATLRFFYRIISKQDGKEHGPVYLIHVYYDYAPSGGKASFSATFRVRRIENTLKRED